MFNQLVLKYVCLWEFRSEVHVKRIDSGKKRRTTKMFAARRLVSRTLSSVAAPLPVVGTTAPGRLLTPSPSALGDVGYVKLGFEHTELQRYFDHCLLDAPDVYYGDYTRFRRYGVLSKDPLNGVWRIVGSSTFKQEPRINKHLPGITRHYKPLTMTLVSDPAFQGLLETFVDATRRDFRKIHCHQIKVMATDETTVTPEGVHQDGFDVVAVACVRRHCITGARNTLRTAQDEPAFFDQVLDEGNILIFDDKLLWHDVSPMLPVNGTRPFDTAAYRDILVLHAVSSE